MHNLKFKKILFIGGMPRSGTTVVANTIQTMLKIQFIPETHYFSIINKSNPIDLNKVPKPVLKNKIIFKFYKTLSKKKVTHKFIEFEKLLKNFSSNSNIVGEKTPSHIEQFSTLSKISRNIYFIVTYRNLFDVCNSLSLMPWNKRSPLVNSIRWFKYYMITIKLLFTIENIYVCFYDDLCSDYCNEISKIKYFLKHDTKDNRNLFDSFNIEDEPWKRNSSKKPFINKSKLNICILYYLPFLIVNILCIFFLKFLIFICKKK